MLNERDEQFEDSELDGLLRNVSVPPSLKASLLSIPDHDSGNPVVERSTVVGATKVLVGMFATLAATVLLYVCFAPTPVVDLASSVASADSGASADSVTPAEDVSELLKEMRENLDSLNQLKNYRIGRHFRRDIETSPILGRDTIPMALAMSWQTALDRGASVNSIEDELQFVVDRYPETNGAEQARRLLLVQ